MANTTFQGFEFDIATDFSQLESSLQQAITAATEANEPVFSETTTFSVPFDESATQYPYIDIWEVEGLKITRTVNWLNLGTSFTYYKIETL